MLSNEQKSLLKRAQRQAGIEDAEYRSALRMMAGVESSTDPRIGDPHLDKLMSYFEAIYWKRHQAGELEAPRGNVPFRAPGYWARKNTAQESSRDRFAADDLAREIARLEAKMKSLGFYGHYCKAVRARVTQGKSDPGALWKYVGALKRCLASKQKTVDQPF